MSTALASQGTTLSIKDSGSTYIIVGGFKSFSDLGGGQASEIDTTDLSSVAKTKLLGLKDFGTIKCDFNFNPHDAGQAKLKTLNNTSASNDMKITYSDGTVEAFTAYVSTFATAAGVDAIVSLSVSLVITGAVTETVGT